MKRLWCAGTKQLALSLLVFYLCVFSVDAVEVRIKDITKFPMATANQLFGFGIVIGLAGTGDSTQMIAPKQMFANLLNRMEDIRLNADDISRAENLAIVGVTADLPAFAKEGDWIDVTVSSVGDAEDLKGGTLLFTRLLAADGNVYATAQGRVVVTVPKDRRARNVPPTGKIAEGGLIVRGLEADLDNLESILLRLNHPDFNTTSLIAKKINETFWHGIAEPLDLGTVKVNVPEDYRERLPNFISTIGELRVQPDAKATVVISEATGSIVIGERVRVSTFAVSYGEGNLTITINKMPAGETTLDDVVNALQAAGATTQDLIEILKLMKNAGALHATLLIM